MKVFHYIIKDELGIHARPAGLLVKEAGKYQSDIKIKKAEKEAATAEMNAEIAKAQAEAARLEAEAAYEAWKAAGDDVILQAEYLAKDAAYKLSTDVALKAAEEAKKAAAAAAAAKKAEVK